MPSSLFFTTRPYSSCSPSNSLAPEQSVLTTGSNPQKWKVHLLCSRRRRIARRHLPCRILWGQTPLAISSLVSLPKPFHRIESLSPPWGQTPHSHWGQTPSYCLTRHLLFETLELDYLGSGKRPESASVSRSFPFNIDPHRFLLTGKDPDAENGVKIASSCRQKRSGVYAVGFRPDTSRLKA